MKRIFTFLLCLPLITQAAHHEIEPLSLKPWQLTKGFTAGAGGTLIAPFTIMMSLIREERNRSLQTDALNRLLTGKPTPRSQPTAAEITLQKRLCFALSYLGALGITSHKLYNCIHDRKARLENAETWRLKVAHAQNNARKERIKKAIRTYQHYNARLTPQDIAAGREKAEQSISVDQFNFACGTLAGSATIAIIGTVLCFNK